MEYPNLDVNHYLRQKSADLSMWTIKSLNTTAEDYDLFNFCFRLIEYLVEYSGLTKNIIDNQVVEDVVREINLF
jgi:hypothetical protein